MVASASGMNLSTKINSFLLVFLVSAVLLTVGAGTLVINSIVYQLNQRFLTITLNDSLEKIEEDYAVLKALGLDQVPAYVKKSRMDLQQLIEQQAGLEGEQVIILEADSANHPGFEMDPSLKQKILDSKKGVQTFDVNGTTYFGVYDSFAPFGWTILVVLDEAIIFAKRDEYVKSMLWLALVVIILAMMVGWRFGKSLSERIEKTLEMVEETGRGDLSRRLRLRQPNDEIGKLQAGINRMVEALQLKTAQQQQTNKALKDSEQYNRMLFEQSPTGLALTDMQGRLLDANPAFAEIIGYTVEQVKELTDRDITPAKYEQQEQQQLQRLKQHGRYGPYDKEYRHRNGQLIPVRLSGLIIERDGEPFIWSSIENIQQQKESEKLRARLMSILESTPDFVGMATRGGQLQYLNKAALQMLGVKKVEALGEQTFMDLLTESSVHTVLEQAIPYAMEQDAWSGECELHLPTGDNIPLLLVLIVHLSDEGEIEYLSVVGRDISEIRQARQALILKRDHLEELVKERTRSLEFANRELEAFSYSVSHDLRTPLRGIDGFSHALLDDYGEILDETAQDYLNRIRRAAQQMGGIIDAMLELARVNRHPLQLETVSLDQLAREAVQRLHDLEPARSLEIVIASGIEVQGDEHILRIVLENLIGNAWKYTAQKKVAYIEFGSTTRAGENVYFVRDNGAGFNMKYADKLFGAFQRLHGAEFDGKGIGLATVQRCIRRLGGRVWGRGEEGKGAEFLFTLGDEAESTPSSES